MGNRFIDRVTGAVAGLLDVNVAQWFGSTAPTVGQKTMANSVPVVLASDQSALPITVSATSAATFYATFDRIVPAGGKYMATLFNTSVTRKAVIQRIWAFNWQVTGVAGVLLDEELRFITARTAGAAVTIYAGDSADVLSAGITADTGSTVVTDSNLIQRIMCSNEENTITPAISAFLVEGRALNDLALVYEKKDGTKGLVLRTNRGVSIKNITASVVGSVSYLVEFTDEPA